jgi:uncharacterized membrane protein YqgA involved in biofilm formation
MLSPLLTTIIIAIIAVVVGIIAGALICLARKYQKLKRDYESLMEIIHGQNNDLRELYASALLVDDRISAIDERLKLLSELVSDSQHDDLSNHPYSLAIQKVKGGASVSELMQNSGLSQDEAALLIRLHGVKPRP